VGARIAQVSFKIYLFADFEHTNPLVRRFWVGRQSMNPGQIKSDFKDNLNWGSAVFPKVEVLMLVGLTGPAFLENPAAGEWPQPTLPE
jgi:hypothetical protein